MAFLWLVGKRLLAQRLLALALLVTMAFAIGVLVAGPIYTQGSREAILSGELAGSDTATKNVRFTLNLTPALTKAQADADVRAAVKNLPVRRVLFDERTPQLDIEGARGSVATFVGYRDGGFGHVKIIRGRMPGTDAEVLVPATDASLLGGPGSILHITNGPGHFTNVAVVGLFTPPAQGDPYWFGSGSMFPQANNPTSPPTNPILVTRAGFEELAARLGLGASQQLNWDVYVDLSNKTLAQISAIAPRAEFDQRRLSTKPGLSTITEVTGLDGITALVSQQIGNAIVPIYLVVFQIGAVAMAVLAGVASLTLSNQGFELAVLKSRGFTRAQLLLAQTIESALAAVVALPIGLIVGMGLAKLGAVSHGALIAGSRFPISLSFTAFASGLGGAILGIALVVLVSIPHVSRTVVEERRLASREDRPVLGRFPVELVVAPLGLFAFLEARSRGLGPNVATGSIDPLVLLAPTLLLFAASFATLRLLSAGLRRADHLIGGLKNLPTYLVGRRLARSASIGFATSLLLILSAGLLVISSSYRATILRSYADLAHQAIGSDWQVQVDSPAQSLAALRKLPPGTTGIFSGQTDVANVALAVSPFTIGIDPNTYAAGGWWRGDYAPQSLPALMDLLKTPSIGELLPGAGKPIQVSIRVPPTIAGYRIEATIERPDGTVVPALNDVLLAGTHDYSGAAVPAGGRLLSIAITRPGLIQAPPALNIQILGVSAGGRPVDLSSWTAIPWLSSSGRVSANANGLTASLRTGTGQVIAAVGPPAGPIPVFAGTDVVAGSGRTFEGTLEGSRFTFEVVAEPRGFPGVQVNQPFIVVPEPALFERLERVPEPSAGLTQVWATGPSNPSAAIRHAGLFVDQVQSAKELEGTFGLNSQSLAIGMHYTAAAGGMGLVVIGVAVGLYFGQRRRRFEFAALRALGTDRRTMLAAMIAEQAAIVGVSLVTAFLLGSWLLRFMMPALGPSITKGFPPPVLVTDWGSLAVFAAAVLTAAAVAVVFSARTVLRTSVTSVLRGEVE